MFDDHERDEAEATRASIVQPAPRSEAARAKDKTKQTEDGLPVHSFRTLLADLGTLAKNSVRVQGESGSEFYELTHRRPFSSGPWTCWASHRSQNRTAYVHVRGNPVNTLRFKKAISVV